MIYLYAYVLFAVTTACTSLYELLIPTIKKQKTEAGTVENETLIYITFFVLVLLTAPYIFLCCIIPSAGEKFRIALQKGLFNLD